jgi:hypothetical protein
MVKLRFARNKKRNLAKKETNKYLIIVIIVKFYSEMRMHSLRVNL